jgi:hypothetical protein
MSAWSALFWGGASSGALLIGQALAQPLECEIKATGVLMVMAA